MHGDVFVMNSTTSSRFYVNSSPFSYTISGDTIILSKSRCFKPIYLQ